MYNKHHDTYVNRLKENPGIEDVAFAMEKVGSKDGYNTNGGNYKGKDFQYFIIIASSNFLRVMGIPVIEGRDFSKGGRTFGSCVLYIQSYGDGGVGYASG